MLLPHRASCAAVRVCGAPDSCSEPGAGWAVIHMVAEIADGVGCYRGEPASAVPRGSTLPFRPRAMAYASISAV